MHSSALNRLSCSFVLSKARFVSGSAAKASAVHSMGPRGAFILFEGVDRCGKSTQTAQLAEALAVKGVPVQSWNFPDRKNTVTGQSINDYLAGKAEQNDKAIHLLFSANRWEKSDALVHSLMAGTTLIVDRYAYSGVAYSAAKGRSGMDIHWCKQPDVGLPAPDLVVYLELSNEQAAARAGFGGERYEKAEFQDKVRAVFQQLKAENWLVIDASQSIEQIHEQIATEAMQVIKRCSEGEPIRQLWDGKCMDLPSVQSLSPTKAPLTERQQQRQDCMT